MLVPIPRLTILRVYDKSKLLNAINYAVMPALIGPILGPLAGGYLVEYASWHWIFLLNLPIGLLGFILGRNITPDIKGSNISLDFKGYLIFLPPRASCYFRQKACRTRCLVFCTVAAVRRTAVCTPLFPTYENRVQTDLFRRPVSDTHFPSRTGGQSVQPSRHQLDSFSDAPDVSSRFRLRRKPVGLAGRPRRPVFAAGQTADCTAHETFRLPHGTALEHQAACRLHHAARPT